MNKTTATKVLAVLCISSTFGCDPAAEPTREDELAALEDYCSEGTGACGEGKADGFFEGLMSFISDLTHVAKGDQSWTTLACPMPDRFRHHVDAVNVGEDGRQNWFTSVQDFVIERPDLSSEEVVDTFQGDWLRWWEGGAIVAGTTTPDADGKPKFTLQPLGISMVEIAMKVHPTQRFPEHPPMQNPSLDPIEGEELIWDHGAKIELNPGNAFVGLMYVLARDVPEGVHVREIWFNTYPISPLVMDVLGSFPFNLPMETRLRVSAFLHIAATQGCALPRGTGYPGLIEAFESGRLPE